ncbi:CDP-alcohol phosphatidyltransferase family protein [Halorutilales archaeon Cl-col2-1]
MTLDSLKPLGYKAVKPGVRAARSLGMTPNQVSVVSLVVAVASGVSFSVGSFYGYVGGSLLVVLNGFLDLVDGELARESGSESKKGDFLDHVLDRYSDAVFVVGISAGTGEWMFGLLALTGVFMTSYMGTQAQAVGAGREYGGALGRADRMSLIVAGGLAHAAFGGVLRWVLILFAVVGNLTAVQRFVMTWRGMD